MIRTLLFSLVLAQILTFNNLQQTNTCTQYPCTQCATTGSTCITCLQQYYLDPSTNQCLSCGFSCVLCDSSSQCNYCAGANYPLNGVCTICPNYPSQCSDQNCCNGCFLNNYYLYQASICNQCITTTICLSCMNGNAPSSCTSCAQGSVLLRGLCVNCSQAINNCLTCNLASLPNVTCSFCVTGYYLSGLNCFMCPYTCTSCQNSTFCTSCTTQYYLNQANQCIPCTTQFCSSCYYQNQQQICQTCLAGYTLTGNECIQQTCGEFCLNCNEWGCINCIQGYFSFQNGCMQCNGGCTSCNGLSNAGCTCAPGTFLIYGGCQLCPSNCSYCIQVSPSQDQGQVNCLVCQPGFYVYWFSNPTISICTACLNNCLYCTSYQNCYLCPTTFYLIDGYCLPCPSNCQNCMNYTTCLICSYSFYLNASQLCSPCMANCINCQNSQTCLLCSPIFNLVNGQCIACPFPIANCNNCNQTYCFICAVQYYFQNGICLPCSSNCNNCLNSTYCNFCDQSWIATANNQCVACGRNCKVCYSIDTCAVCISTEYLISGAICVAPFVLHWWETTCLVILLILIILFVALTLREQIVSKQIRALVLNNLKINFRNRLYLKETIVTIFILLVIIIEIETQQSDIFLNPRAIMTFYNILVIILISRASVMIHMQNRNKFLYFQKAYGLNSIAYTLTWTLYSLLSGAIHFFIYILLQYIYLKSNNDFFSKNFYGNDFPGTMQMTYEQFCLVNFLGYISTYSFFLLAVIIVNHNQIGLKLLTPILVLGLLGIAQDTLYTQVNLKKFIYLSPIGWLVSISNNRLLPTQYFLPQYEYLPVFFAHFFIPLILAFLIQFIKINQVQIKILLIKNYRILKSRIKPSSKIQLLNQTQMEATVDLSWLIKIQNLKKSVNKKIILNNINLIIRKGEVISLYGKNGSAKSTLLNILTNIDHFSQGSFVFSKQIKIGISLQDNFFEDQLTVKQNLYFYAKLKGVNIKDEAKAFEEFGLSDFWNKHYYKISGGSRKKLSIACAFLGENDIVLLDYPTMGIDYTVKREIQQIIKKQKQKNSHLTIIITTCNLELDFINQIDRLWVIEKGEIIIDEQISSIKLQEQNIIVGEITHQKDNQPNTKQLENIKDIKIKRQKKKTCLSFHQKYFLNIVQILKKQDLLKNFQFSTASIKDLIQWKIRNALNQESYQQNLEQSLQKIKTQYVQLEPKQSFFYLFVSSLVIRYYQIAPSIFDLLYLLLMPLTCWEYMLWLLDYRAYLAERSIGLGFFLQFYPFLFIFMYSHISVCQVKFQENGYQNMIFKTGMKKISYWLASYLINIIILYIPSLIMIAATQQQTSYIHLFALQVFLYSVTFTFLSYFCSMFFQSHYVCFSFLSIIFSTVNAYCYSLNIYLWQKKAQSTPVFMQRLYMAIIPGYLSIFSNFNLQTLICFIVNVFIYSFLYFVTKQVIYRFNNYKKNINSQQMLENTYEGAIQQKLKILDMVQNPSQNQNAALIISDVYLKYSKTITGIKGLNLCIEKGSVLALLGMNGSGKSTTLKLIINQVFKTIGSIYFNFQEIKSETSQIYQGVSISPQYNYFIPSMKVIIHLRIFCALKGIKYGLQTQLIHSLLKIFNMEDCANLEIQQISGGNQRKLKFITALLGKPKFLLMDEPTIGVDDESEEVFGKILMLLAEQFNSSCVYVTHKLNQVEKYCTKLAIMKRGGLVLCDYNKKLIQKYSRGVQLNLYSQSLQKLQAIVKKMLDQHIKVYQSLLIEESSLLRILIPFEQFKFDICLDVILCLKEKGDIYAYELKKEGLAETFDYMVNQTDTALIISPAQQKIM